ncbi:hypothetical protein TIFTF001_051430, partial [Ficus carica]
AGGTIDGVAPVCDPNDGSNWDFPVPNSHVTILGLSEAEETELEHSSFRNHGCSITDGLE